MKTVFDNADEVLDYFYMYILGNGIEKDGTMYVRNVSFGIMIPEENKITAVWRSWNENYAKLEYEWYKKGDRSPAMVEKIAKLWSTIKDDSGYVNSNYGNWWKRNQQHERCLKMLSENKNTRRAVMVHYDVDDIQNYGKDTPCNLVVNFYIDASGRLCLTVFARSIDLIYGFCNDQYCFSRLLIDSAKLLKRSVGLMHYFITDLHIYEKHYNLKSN